MKSLSAHLSDKTSTILDMELVSPSEPIGRLRYELARELGRRGHKVIVLQMPISEATPKLRKGL